MLKYIQEYRKYCEIAGFKNAKMSNTDGFLEAINRKKPLDVEVQFFDTDLIATWQHIYFSVLNAMLAFRNRENISKSLAMETMLYASVRRQIHKATQLVGIKPTSQNIAVLIVEGKPEAVESALARISTCIAGQPDDLVLALSEEKIKRIKRAFEISEAELETVMERDGVEKTIVDLVIERMALLATAH
jgi:tRNA threonylcarbamoyladenosine modification (KEOPS) complex Cgi121 subunit